MRCWIVGHNFRIVRSGYLFSIAYCSRCGKSKHVRTLTKRRCDGERTVNL